MMRIASVLVAALTLAFMAHAGGQERSYSYRGWLVDQALSIEPPSAGSADGSIVIGGDAIYKTRFCPSKSKYWCFVSPVYAFVIPKRLQAGTSRWSFEELEFQVVDRDISISLFGTRVSDLLLIKLLAGARYGAEPTDRETFYLFSQTRGLLGFGFDPAFPHSVAFWSTEHSGFGAADR